MKNHANYSKIIAGSMTWGSWGKQFSTQQMTGLIYHCLDLGISTFDHADIYGGYTTEAEFGAAFAASTIQRDSIQIISKCGIQMDAEMRPNSVKHYEYSKAYIINSVEKSIKNLKTDYLDMLLLHRPSPLMNPEIIADTITTLQTQGKIRDFGVSNFAPSQIRMLEKEIPVGANQIEFSLTANNVMYDGTLDDCITEERMAMSWSPLGIVFRENTEQVLRIRKVLEKMATKYRTTEDVLLLAWVMKHPANVHPVVGTTRRSRLTDAVKAIRLALELEKTDWFVLLEASNGNQVP